jgi:hypothetical protein
MKVRPLAELPDSLTPEFVPRSALREACPSPPWIILCTQPRHRQPRRLRLVFDPVGRLT